MMKKSTLLKKKWDCIHNNSRRAKPKSTEQHRKKNNPNTTASGCRNPRALTPNANRAFHSPICQGSLPRCLSPVDCRNLSTTNKVENRNSRWPIPTLPLYTHWLPETGSTELTFSIPTALPSVRKRLTHQKLATVSPLSSFPHNSPTCRSLRRSTPHPTVDTALTPQHLTRAQEVAKDKLWRLPNPNGFPKFTVQGWNSDSLGGRAGVDFLRGRKQRLEMACVGVGGNKVRPLNNEPGPGLWRTGVDALKALGLIS